MYDTLQLMENKVLNVYSVVNKDSSKEFIVYCRHKTFNVTNDSIDNIEHQQTFALVKTVVEGLYDGEIIRILC